LPPASLRPVRGGAAHPRTGARWPKSRLAGVRLIKRNIASDPCLREEQVGVFPAGG
jgi:hypothetical protein